MLKCRKLLSRILHLISMESDMRYAHVFCNTFNMHLLINLLVSNSRNYFDNSFYAFHTTSPQGLPRSKFKQNLHIDYISLAYSLSISIVLSEQHLRALHPPAKSNRTADSCSQNAFKASCMSSKCRASGKYMRCQVKRTHLHIWHALSL